MARCEVVQVQCDRCKRVEMRPPTPPKALPDFELVFVGKRVKFDDCCERCRTTLERLIELVEQWERTCKMPFGPTLSSDQAPPVHVAPSYKPPQPHAANSGRR